MMNDLAKTLANWSQTAGEPAWLQAQRASKLTAYTGAALPVRTEEAWKYTNLEPWWNWQTMPWQAGRDTIARAAQLPDGAVCCSLADALSAHAALATPYIQLRSTTAEQLQRRFSGVQGRAYGGERYVHQHDALWTDGTFVSIPAGASVTAPIRINFTADAAPHAAFPRTIIVLGEGASATIVDHYTGMGDAALACHARVEIYLAPSARLNYVNVQVLPRQATYLLHQHAMVGRDAHLAATNITLGGTQTKTIVESALTAPGAESYLFGLAFGDGAQHHDQHTLQTHLAPNTHSDLLYKTALKDTARAIYTGLIHMHEAAQQAAAYQANRNLLLSSGAQANAIPQLEIEADDVKCSHGATIGPIDPEQCYYLQARGLGKVAAEELVVTGFFEELVARIPDATVADIVRHTIADKLGGAAAL